MTERKNYEFIDAIRGIAMMCIVFEHCVHVGIYLFPDIAVNNIIYMSIVQFAKFGTTTFFILAGFLLGSKFFDYSPLEYFKRRLSTTFVPWLIWSLLFVFTMSWRNWIPMHKKPGFDMLQLIGQSFTTVYLYSNYWFIINFLVCIGLLLFVRKHLYSKWLGAILFLFTTVYSVNIYLEWFPPMHTMAIFGFVFFLWLGAQFNKNWGTVSIAIEKIPNALLLVLFLICYALSVYEIAVLYKLHSIDPYNTLRFSNILYSLVCIIILFKFQKFRFTGYFRARETTFGIYLVHYILVFNLLPELLRPFHIPPVNELPIPLLLLVSMLRFVIVYSLSYGLVYFLNKTRFKWLIGR